MASQPQWWPFGGSSTNSTRLCENCGVRPKFQNHNYCGKACSTAAETRRNSAAQAANAQGPPTSGARQDPFTYSLSSGPNAPAASNMCENCRLRVKSQEPDEAGTVITHPYCGIRCYQASQQTPWPASTIPAPAAASVGHEPLKLWVERTNTLMGRQISLMMQERWKSDRIHIPKLKAIYRIDTPGQVSRRFDLALQINDGCPVTTTYYGAIATCSIADDTDPVPCASESCDLCDALRSSFGNLLYGASCNDGAYGSGLYTYSNPALAYYATVPDNDLKTQGFNCALIQSRVVIKADSMPSSNSYAGFIDDSGVVFCAQATAIIPTHLLICNKTVPSKESQQAIPVSPSWVSLGPGPPTATPIAGGIGQQVDASDTGETKPNPMKGSKGKGRAQAKVPPQKLSGKSSGADSSSKQQADMDVKESEPSEYPSSFTSTQEIHQPSTGSASIPGPPKLDSTIVRKEPETRSQPNSAIETRPVKISEKQSESHFGLSNLSYTPINYPDPNTALDKQYPTPEHLFQAMKFMGHKPLIAEHIRTCGGNPKPREEARRFAFEQDPSWTITCLEKMYEVLQLKFQSYPGLEAELIGTGEADLVLDSSDTFWGCGTDGRGQNQLGSLLMRLRQELVEVLSRQLGQTGLSN